MWKLRPRVYDILGGYQHSVNIYLNLVTHQMSRKYGGAKMATNSDSRISQKMERFRDYEFVGNHSICKFIAYKRDRPVSSVPLIGSCKLKSILSGQRPISPLWKEKQCYAEVKSVSIVVFCLWIIITYFCFSPHKIHDKIKKKIKSCGASGASGASELRNLSFGYFVLIVGNLLYSKWTTKWLYINK